VFALDLYRKLASAPGNLFCSPYSVEAALAMVTAGAAGRTRDELVALLDLERLLNVPVRQLSLGQRMRCEIAAAMLHEPRVLFLDEPTIGLDAVAKLAVRDFVSTLNRDHGVTVILTTHDMHDVEALAERVIVIGNGTILADGTLASLRGGVLAERRLRVLLVADDDGMSAFEIPGVTVRERSGRSVELSFDPRVVAAHALVAQIAARFDVEDVHLEDPPIEQVIARFYTLHALDQ